MNFNEDLHIDLLNLHLETRSQPIRLMKYVTELANAKREQSFLERKVKLARARAAQKVRLTSGKVTVDQVKEEIELDPDVNEAEDASINAQYNTNLLAGAVEAFKGRKTQISDSIELYKMGYYNSESDLPNREYVDDVEEKQMEDVLQDQMESFKRMLNKE